MPSPHPRLPLPPRRPGLPPSGPWTRAGATVTRVPLLLVGLLLLAGCPSSSSMQVGCRSGEDCPSGTCLRDGTCGEEPEADAGGPPADAGEGAGDGGADAGTPDTGAPDAGTPGLCIPNGDGTLSPAELPLRAGLSGTFRTALDVVWNSAGEPLADGGVRWDLATALPGDTSEPLRTLDMTGAWYADSFPTATYAAKLSSTSDLLGIFRLSVNGLWLLGIASPDSGLSQTKVTYDPPFPVLPLPLKQGDRWQLTTTAMGFFEGVYSFWTESYDSTVTARGELLTPLGTFPVLRVSTGLDRTVGLLVTRTRSHAFVSECFGTVATVTSEPGETATEFISASEIRRLSP
jgi:hypothetical protein